MDLWCNILSVPKAQKSQRSTSLTRSTTSTAASLKVKQVRKSSAALNQRFFQLSVYKQTYIEQIFRNCKNFFRNFRKFLLPGQEHSLECRIVKKGFWKVEIFTIENRQKIFRLYILPWGQKCFQAIFISKDFEFPKTVFKIRFLRLENSWPGSKNFKKFRKKILRSLILSWAGGQPTNRITSSSSSSRTSRPTSRPATATSVRESHENSILYSLHIISNNCLTKTKEILQDMIGDLRFVWLVFPLKPISKMILAKSMVKLKD